MDKAKQARLEAAGFRVGTVGEFLGLTPAESALVEARLAGAPGNGTDLCAVDTYEGAREQMEADGTFGLVHPD